MIYTHLILRWYFKYARGGTRSSITRYLNAAIVICFMGTVAECLPKISRKYLLRVAAPATATHWVMCVSYLVSAFRVDASTYYYYCCCIFSVFDVFMTAELLFSYTRTIRYSSRFQIIHIVFHTFPDNSKRTRVVSTT